MHTPDMEVSTNTIIGLIEPVVKEPWQNRNVLEVQGYPPSNIAIAIARHIKGFEQLPDGTRQLFLDSDIKVTGLVPSHDLYLLDRNAARHELGIELMLNAMADDLAAGKPIDDDFMVNHPDLDGFLKTNLGFDNYHFTEEKDPLTIPLNIRAISRLDMEEVIDKAELKPKAWKLAPSIASLAAAVTACTLAAPPPPAIVETIQTPAPISTPHPEITATVPASVVSEAIYRGDIIGQVPVFNKEFITNLGALTNLEPAVEDITFDAFRQGVKEQAEKAGITGEVYLMKATWENQTTRTNGLYTLIYDETTQTLYSMFSVDENGFLLPSGAKAGVVFWEMGGLYDENTKESFLGLIYPPQKEGDQKYILPVFTRKAGGGWMFTAPWGGNIDLDKKFPGKMKVLADLIAKNQPYEPFITSPTPPKETPIPVPIPEAVYAGMETGDIQSWDTVSSSWVIKDTAGDVIATWNSAEKTWVEMPKRLLESFADPSLGITMTQTEAGGWGLAQEITTTQTITNAEGVTETVTVKDNIAIGMMVQNVETGKWEFAATATDFYSGTLGSEPTEAITGTVGTDPTYEKFGVVVLKNEKGETTYVWDKDLGTWRTTEMHAGLPTRENAGNIIRDDHPEDMEALIAVEQAANANSNLKELFIETDAIIKADMFPYSFYRISTNNVNPKHGFCSWNTLIMKDGTIVPFIGVPFAVSITDENGLTSKQTVMLHIAWDEVGQYNMWVRDGLNPTRWDSITPQAVLKGLRNGSQWIIFDLIMEPFDPAKHLIVEQDWDLAEKLIKMNNDLTTTQLEGTYYKTQMNAFQFVFRISKLFTIDQLKNLISDLQRMIFPALAIEASRVF